VNEKGRLADARFIGKPYFQVGWIGILSFTICATRDRNVL
jgi:hypothetical protein